MPTYAPSPRFLRDYQALGPPDRDRFQRVLRESFIPDMTNQMKFRPGLRVKRVQGTDDVWEMTWAPNGRTTFTYGDEVIPGEPHVIWRRIGTHAILNSP